MNIADIMKLSIGGYSKDQIKEMGTMTKECPELLDYATKNGKAFDDVKELYDFAKELNGPEAPAPDPAPEPSLDTGKSDQAAELEKKIAELTKQNEELNKSIQSLQSQNIHTDQSGKQEDPMEAFGQIVAAYM